MQLYQQLVELWNRKHRGPALAFTSALSDLLLRTTIDCEQVQHRPIDNKHQQTTVHDNTRLHYSDRPFPFPSLPTYSQRLDAQQP